MSGVVRSRSDSSVIFRFAEFTFDSRSRLLTQNGVERHLSPKAQQLLHLLLRARPDALSRQQLYDALWPSTFVCETNLASLVNEVRRALGDDARSAQYIRTVHGFGYAFSGEVTSTISGRFEAGTLLCEGRSHPLFDGNNVVGRAFDNRIVITDSTVSRRHAMITIRNDELSITDLDSKNGTYVNGQKISGATVPIPNNARIMLGAIIATIKLRKFSSTASLKLEMSEIKRLVAKQLKHA